MPKLHIDLQEGFTGDVVNLKVNGRESLHEEGVTTKRMLGLATSAEIEVPEGIVHLEIEVPTKNLSKTISLHTAEVSHLGISIHDGEIEHIASQQPFGYA